ncbi:unnamed protein product [Protopolystoma xenopodis]|uniref:Uncharacterized protein n=1 Tax=Protopolystoma xenopodis TaxID=117903 RepID=A0A448XKC0_9PLAT|nr:unnamed protein product [Protopolystoma xenopodis]
MSLNAISAGRGDSGGDEEPGVHSDISEVSDLSDLSKASLRSTQSEWPQTRGGGGVASRPVHASGTVSLSGVGVRGARATGPPTARGARSSAPSAAHAFGGGNTVNSPKFSCEFGSSTPSNITTRAIVSAGARSEGGLGGNGKRSKASGASDPGFASISTGSAASASALVATKSTSPSPGQSSRASLAPTPVLLSASDQLPGIGHPRSARGNESGASSGRKRRPSIGQKFSTVLGLSRKSSSTSNLGERVFCSYPANPSQRFCAWRH